MSYWEIDNFLAQEQKLACSFTEDTPRMEFIDPSKGITGGIVPAELPLHVPIWLANTIR